MTTAQKNRIEWLRKAIFQNDRYKGGQNTASDSEFSKFKVSVAKDKVVHLHAQVGFKNMGFHSIWRGPYRHITISSGGGMLLFDKEGVVVREGRRKIKGKRVAFAAPDKTVFKQTKKERREAERDLEKGRVKNTSSGKYHRNYRR